MFTGRLRPGIKRCSLVAAALLLGAGALLYLKAETIVLGAEAYLYGYPLVILDITRATAAQTLGPENHLLRVRQFPNAAFRAVVRPNVDTLYTTAFIDTGAGPWVVEMAPKAPRYELMPFMDAWTNVFAAPGTRSNSGSNSDSGSAGGRFLLVGPDWQGETPAGLTLMRAPTQIVWLIGRTQTNGVADYPLVHRLQDGVTLRSLDAWRSDAPPTVPTWEPAAKRPPPPLLQMQHMPVETFFTRLALLMRNNPPAAVDAPMLQKLARLGIAPGQPPDWTLLDRWSVRLGRWIADRRVAKEMAQPRGLVRGWSMPPAILGNYGADYKIRAAVAMFGLGANLPEDAMYPHARVDANGEPLNGRFAYRLHFEAGQLPPVQAFWSVTAYGMDDFLIDNPLQRHALGDRDPLIFNADGSLDLYVQANSPGAGKENNWLPVKHGEPFLLNARLYWPKAAALDGSWGMPAVERVE